MPPTHRLTIVSEKDRDELENSILEATSGLEQDDRTQESYSIKLPIESKKIRCVVSRPDHDSMGGREVSTAGISILDKDDFRRSSEAQEAIGRILKTIARNIDLYVAFFHISFEMLSELIEPIIDERRPTKFAHMNYFGRELAEKIGRERLDTAPAYEVSEINGGFYLRPLKSFQDYMAKGYSDLENHLNMKYS